MNRRQLVVVLLIFAVATVVIIGGLSRHTNNAAQQVTFTPGQTAAPTPAAGTAPTTFGAPDMSAAMKLQSNDASIKSGDFTVGSTSEPAPGWYVARVYLAGGVTGSAIFTAADNKLKLVLGPTDTTSVQSLQNQGVPQEVLDVIGASND